MLRTTQDLRRSAVKWVSQVSVSVGATLIATMIYGALPWPATSVPTAAPELTSGGKFAARVEPASAVAYDGLDTMPLPRVAALTVPVAFLNTPASVGGDAVEAQPAALIRQAVLDGAGQDRPARKSAKPSPRNEARRAAVPAERPQLISLAAAESPGDAKADDGLLPKVMSTARTAWTATASTGGALLSRLIP